MSQVRTMGRTMSENPALEWSTGRPREEREEPGEVVLGPILYNLQVKLMAPPPPLWCSGGSPETWCW